MNSRLGKVSLVIGLSSMLGLVLYIFIVMDGRTHLNRQDSWFFWSAIIIAAVSVVITIADRVRTRGEEFSWKRFGIILLIILLVGLWRITL
jgi:uncharacterized membrane protein YiaA